ncbi:MAG: pseudoazurin [Devosia sp.]
MILKFVASALAVMVLVGTTAQAAEFTVNMLNKDSTGRTMQFEPAFLKVAPGDTINFVPVDKGHDSETIANGFPAGAEAWKGKISQTVSVTLTVEGLYAYKCLPHVGLGMVGLIQVGDDTGNLEALKTLKLPSKARTRLDELLAEQAAATAVQ